MRWRSIKCSSYLFTTLGHLQDGYDASATTSKHNHHQTAFLKIRLQRHTVTFNADWLLVHRRPISVFVWIWHENTVLIFVFFPENLCFLFVLTALTANRRVRLNMTRKYCVNHCVIPEFCVFCFVLTARRFKKHGKIVFFLNWPANSVPRYTVTLCHTERHENIVSICFQCGQGKVA